MSDLLADSVLEKFTTFGDLLRFLRRRAGLTQMELSIAVGYSDTQISRLEQNLRLPDIPTLEARFLPALDLANIPNAATRLLELAAQVRREDTPVPGLSPYKGLNYFDEADTELFVGRESLTAKLVNRVFALSKAPSRFLAVVGASGSGKTSVIRAGLVPRLRADADAKDWDTHVFTPTSHPLEALVVSLTQGDSSILLTATLIDELAHEPRGVHLFARKKTQSESCSSILLVIDQFEELFTLCHSEEERRLFIDNLVTAANEVDGRVIVVITLRADFYAHCATYSQLREILAYSQVYIGMMSDEELRRAIEEPARRGHWELESPLTDLLLQDVGHEPGSLPLLSHALLETWQRRRGRTMTLHGYAASGGVRGAIAETAEAVFADQFTREEQIIARNIFLRLTEPGGDASMANTRRRATFDELILKPEEALITRTVLNVLVNARLVTTNADSVEVAHEVLIREWPTLRSWLEENRESLRLHRQLTDTALEWSLGNREPGLLYRGARLAQVREWAKSHEMELNSLESEFIHAATEASEREARERELQRQRELEAARQLAEVERRRVREQTDYAQQMRQRARYLAGAFLVTLVMASIALSFSNRSNQYALAALNARATVAANNDSAARLLNAMFGRELIPITGETPASRLFARSLDKKKTASIDSNWTVLVTDGVTGATLFTLEDNTYAISDLCFSPDGTKLASSNFDGTVRVWDLMDGKPLLTLVGHSAGVQAVTFSPDGSHIATASSDTTSIIWDANTGKPVLTLLGDVGMRDLVYSPDGTRIATANMDGTVTVWDTATGISTLTLRGYVSAVNTVAFSTDGKWIASIGLDGTTIVWDAATGDIIYQFSH